MKGYWEKIKHHFQQVWELKTSPHSIALGFAVGTFVAILPTPGVNIIIGLFLLTMIRSMNKISLLASFVVWNYFVTVPLYTLAFTIGDMLFVNLSVVAVDIGFWDFVYHFTRRFLVGNIIVAASFSLISYGVVRLVSEIVQRRRQ